MTRSEINWFFLSAILWGVVISGMIIAIGLGAVAALNGALAQEPAEKHYTNARGASLPNCPKMPDLKELPRLMREEPDRYRMGPYTWGDEKQPRRCIEIVDTKQKAYTAMGGERPCRVALDCDT